MNANVVEFLENETNWKLDNISSIERIGGLSSENFKVIYKNVPYFIKICTHTYLHTDKENEFNILKTAYIKDIAPNIIYFSKNTGNMIATWIDGYMPTEYEFKSENFLSNLTNKLKKLHALKCNKKFNPFKHIKERLTICKNLNLPLPKSLDNLIAHLDNLEYLLTKDPILGLCHNDLNVSNIILSSNNIYFVDYEYSSMGDIFFDLATISWFLDENSRKLLLIEYFGFFNEKNYSKLLDYLFIVKFYNATWSLLKSTDTTSNYDYILGASMIFDDLLNSNSVRIYKT